jgi:hypothetical protein
VKAVLGVMGRHQLLDWSTILVGWDRTWLSKEGISDFAVEQLERASSESIVELLARIDGSDTQEIRNLIENCAKATQADYTAAVEKWRFAFLVALSEDPKSPEEKIDDLQDLYSAFDYPEDMRDCGRYGPSRQAIPAGTARVDEVTVDPLNAMARLLRVLAARIGVKHN